MKRFKKWYLKETDDLVFILKSLAIGMTIALAWYGISPDSKIALNIFGYCFGTIIVLSVILAFGSAVLGRKSKITDE